MKWRKFAFEQAEYWYRTVFGRMRYLLTGKKGQRPLYSYPVVRTNAMLYDEYSPPSLHLYKRYRDYVRYRAFELVREQIGDLPGNVAELGVFAGQTAALINHYFPDRTLFLYDTFASFPEEDLSYDLASGFIDGGDKKKEIVKDELKVPLFDPISLIKERLPFPDKCVFRKGYFPDTAAPDKDEMFIFVSTDVDLYKPHYAGLEFFYPRLREGGVYFYARL
ncbi:MAG: TylF/MycF family methyltransferase [Holosporales bacterium]|nr:TylF/MycF family methyltransferase [Holosporales bacterium]